MDRVVQVFKSFEEADEAEAEYYARLTPNERVVAGYHRCL